MRFKGLRAGICALFQRRLYQLTDAELDALTGDREALVRALQDKYHLTEDIARREADRWIRQMGG